MFGSPSVRLYIIAALIPLTSGGAYLVNRELEPPEVDLPDWTFNEMPLQIGDWHGEKATLDPELAKATGAQVIVDRIYKDDAGHAISVHTAMFQDPKGGVYHSPLNCYRSNGWQKLSETSSDLQISDTLTIPVSVTRWEHQNDKVIVVYWYQLGKHVLFGRWDLGFKVRWSLAGKPKWPALIKVMLQIPASEPPEEARAAILNFAEQVAKWENQPTHRNGKGMLGTSESPVSSDR